MLVLLIGGCDSSEQEENTITTLIPSGDGAELETAKDGYYELISVKMSDKSNFLKEEWNKILKQIEKGEVILNDK